VLAAFIAIAIGLGYLIYRKCSSKNQNPGITISPSQFDNKGGEEGRDVEDVQIQYVPKAEIGSIFLNPD
jgi:hypothetical protein